VVRRAVFCQAFYIGLIDGAGIQCDGHETPGRSDALQLRDFGLGVAAAVKPAKIIEQLLKMDVIEHPELPIHTTRDQMRLSDGRWLWLLFWHESVISFLPGDVPALLSGAGIVEQNERMSKG
jgi:hypothetical protein